MPTEEEQHRDHEERPHDPTEGLVRQDQGSGRRRERDVGRPSTENRVRNVAAVELSDREEVQRRRQEPEPSGERHGVHVDVRAVRQSTPNRPRDALEEQRFSQLERARWQGVRQLDHARHRDAEHERR